MSNNSKNINLKLFNLLKVNGLKPIPLNADGKKIPSPKEADVFQFTLPMKVSEQNSKIPKNIIAHVTIDDENVLKVLYDDSETSLSPMWTKIINMLKRFGTGRQLDFELVDDDEMPYEMEKRKEMKEMKKSIKEDQEKSASFMDRIKKLTSLEKQDNDSVDDAAELAAGFVPGAQQALSARDFERARREGDLTGMGVAAASALPVVGGVVRGASKLGKFAKKALSPKNEPTGNVTDTSMQWSRKDPTGTPTPTADNMGRQEPTLSPTTRTQTGQRTTQPVAAPAKQPLKINPAVVATTAAGTAGLGAVGLSQMNRNATQPPAPAPVPATAPAPVPAQVPKTSQQTSQSVNQIAQMNKIVDPNKIRVGQEITLPSGQKYTVAKGDTLWGISRGQFKNPQMAPKTPPTTARSQSAPTLQPPSSATARRMSPSEIQSSSQTSYSSSDLPTPRMGPVKESYLKEGYHAINKKMSYNDAIPEVKLVIHHSKVLENEDVRYRNIEKIYIENAHGEKILSPSRSVGLSKIYARILAEGDKPYCDKWNHVTQIVEDYIKLSRFARATKNGPFNEGAQRLIDSSNMHLQGLRESLKKLSSYRGFHNYFDNWSPILNENSEESIDLSEMFINQSLDPRIEDALPILSKLGTKLIESDLPVVEELIQWSDNLEESLNKPKLGYGEIPSKYGKLGRGITVKPKQHDKSAKTVDDINKPDKASLLPGSRFRDIPY